jgi:hypothetical protein
MEIQKLLQSNASLQKAFTSYQARNKSLDLIVNVSLGNIPVQDRQQIKGACASYLGSSTENGITMDQVLSALSNAGFHNYIDKTSTVAKIQLVSVGHELRNRELILRYHRILDF